MNDQVQGPEPKPPCLAPQPASSNPNFILQRSPMGWPVSWPQSWGPSDFFLQPLSPVGPLVPVYCSPWGELGLSIADPGASCTTWWCIYKRPVHLNETLRVCRAQLSFYVVHINRQLAQPLNPSIPHCLGLVSISCLRVCIIGLVAPTQWV